MAQKLRCAVIGTGAIGLDHLQSLSTCPRASSVAVAESHPQRAREACERFRIPRCYHDYRELLEQPDIEAVTIAVPNHLHARIALDALDAGKHVLIEKPFATSLKEARKVADAARRTRCTVMVAQTFRFQAPAQMARLMVQRGELGDVYHVRTFWLRTAGIPRIGSWFTQKSYAGGGCVYDLGVHALDLSLHLLNDFDVVSVSGATHCRMGPKGLGEGTWGRSEVDPAKPCDVEDYGMALLKLKSGKTIWLEVSWAGFHPAETREFGLDLLGTEGGLSLFPARLYRNGQNGYETTLLSIPRLPHREDRIHHFVECALHGKKPMVTLEESLKVQEVLDALYQSARSGKEVRLHK